MPPWELEWGAFVAVGAGVGVAVGAGVAGSVGVRVGVAVAAAVGVSFGPDASVSVVGEGTTVLLEQAIALVTASTAATSASFANRDTLAPPREMGFAERSELSLDSLVAPSGSRVVEPPAS